MRAQGFRNLIFRATVRFGARAVASDILVVAFVEHRCGLHASSDQSNKAKKRQQDTLDPLDPKPLSSKPKASKHVTRHLSALVS